MKKYSLLAAAMILSSSAVFAVDSDSQALTVTVEATENIWCSAPTVGITATYVPATASSSGAPTLEGSAGGGTLHVWGTNPCAVTVQFAPDAATQVAWGGTETLTVTAAGVTRTIYNGGAAIAPGQDVLIAATADGTSQRDLTYNFVSTNTALGSGNLTGTVTFTASAAL